MWFNYDVSDQIIWHHFRSSISGYSYEGFCLLLFKAGNNGNKPFLTNLGIICHEQEGIDGIDGFDERIKVELKDLALGSLYVHPKPSLPQGRLTGKPWSDVLNWGVKVVVRNCPYLHLHVGFTVTPPSFVAQVGIWQFWLKTALRGWP